MFFYLFQTFHNCLRFASDEALQNQGFETLKELLEVDNEIIVEYSLRSLAEITFNSAGKVVKLINSSCFIRV